MMNKNIFATRSAEAMLIAGPETDPFDSKDYIFEIKFDGIRSLAYVSNTGADLRNKRNKQISFIYPELKEIYKNINEQCILDGEIAVLINGKPVFSEVQARSLMGNSFKIELAARRNPVTFIVYDILYYKDEQITGWPLMERKALLDQIILINDRIVVSKYISDYGIELYKLAKENQLEGIVCKRKESKYKMGKRTKDWIKIKNMLDDDFVIMGYNKDNDKAVSLILGQYSGATLVYKAHVALGVSSRDYKLIAATPRFAYDNIQPDENSILIEPIHVCTVKYMERTAKGGLRQPVFKGIRNDKLPEECKS